MAISTIGTNGIEDGAIVASDIAAGAVTQSKLGTNVAGTGPAFSYIANSTTSLPSATFTKVNFASLEFDTTSGMYASSRFTPTVAGYYYITGSAYYSTASNSFVVIYKNGSEVKRGTDHGSQVYSRVVNALIYLNGTTDYVEIYAYQSSGSTMNVIATSSETYFQAFLARAA